MSTVRGWRTIVGLKERRLDKLNEALKATMEHLQQKQQALESARAHETECRDLEQQQRDLLMSTGMRGSFKASDIVTLQHLLQEAEGKTVAAGKETKRADDGVQAARQQVAQAQQAVRRGEQQLEKCRERLKQAIDDVQKAQDDQQDEESEEAAVARMLAAAREEASEALALA